VLTFIQPFSSSASAIIKGMPTSPNDGRNVSSMGESEGPHRDDDAFDDFDGEWTPPVMWPEAGSGFEADPFSPAGMSQQIWRATGRRPRSRAGLWTVRIVCVVIAVAFIAAQVVH
jgi:hypothetical protein